MSIFKCLFLTLVSIWLIPAGLAQVEPAKTIEPSSRSNCLEGDWSITTESGQPAWMRLVHKAGKPKVFMRIYVGPKGPCQITKLTDEEIKFSMKRKASVTQVEAKLTEAKLIGSIKTLKANGHESIDNFTGLKISAMPDGAPDLSKIRFGEKIILFNGKDLSGWRAHEANKINGWSVKDGILANTTPKTDFSATGAYANLRTETTYHDFRLHIEFKIGTQRNSGVYLRGMYEAQVVDRNSRMQGIQGPGAIFGEIKPSFNAGKAGNKWQSYDLTLGSIP